MRNQKHILNRKINFKKTKKRQKLSLLIYKKDHQTEKTALSPIFLTTSDEEENIKKEKVFSENKIEPLVKEMFSKKFYFNSAT